MNRVLKHKKGMLLFIVLATIFIVLILGNILINIMLTQGRLTTHQISRIQAHYAAMAGINYAYENLRAGTWNVPGAGNCGDQIDLMGFDADQFPPSIISATVVVAGRGATCGPVTQACNPPAGIPVCISTFVDYEYSS